MQERRTTLRVTYACQGHVCSTNDLLPRTGRITNLSERGAGLLLRDPPGLGDQVTMTFPLPGEAEAVTATGLVRWVASQRVPGRWSPLGIEWLPLEESVRHRLSRSLYRFTQRRTAPPGALRRVGTITLVMVGLAIVSLSAWWASALSQKNRRLQEEMSYRTAVMRRVEAESARLRGELGVTTAQLKATSEHVAQLDQQATQLEGQVQRFRADVDDATHAYVSVREERDQLIQHVLGLEQQRLAAARSLVPQDELRRAVRETIATHRRARSRAGNRGYLIHVHDPVVSP